MLNLLYKFHSPWSFEARARYPGGAVYRRLAGHHWRVFRMNYPQFWENYPTWRRASTVGPLMAADLTFATGLFIFRAGMSAAKYDFTIEQNVTFQATVIWKKKNSLPMDMTGVNLRSEMKSRDGELIAVLADGVASLWAVIVTLSLTDPKTEALDLQGPMQRRWRDDSRSLTRVEWVADIIFAVAGAALVVNLAA